MTLWELAEGFKRQAGLELDAHTAYVLYDTAELVERWAREKDRKYHVKVKGRRVRFHSHSSDFVADLGVPEDK